MGLLPICERQDRREWARQLIGIRFGGFGERTALVVLCCFLLLPILLYPVLGGGRGGMDLLYAFNLVASFLWMLLLHVVVRRPLVLHMVLLPLYLTTMIDLFLLTSFGNRISAGYVMIALSNYGELDEFLAAYVKPVALTVSVSVVVYVYAMFGLRNVKLPRAPRLAVLLVALLMAIYGSAVGRGLQQKMSLEQAVYDVIGKEMSAPFGVVFQGVVALNQFIGYADLRRKREYHIFGALKNFAEEDEIYVWVIGESSRPHNWSLFGYERETTPLLEKLPGLIGLPNMLATAPHTSVAVPSMLSLDPVNRWEDVLSHKSIISAFGEVGFGTYWISAQEVDGWAGIVPQIAAEAAHTRYYDRALDGKLVNAMEDILNENPSKRPLFIVLHTKGSHWVYSRRYPSEYDHFQTAGSTRRAQLVDSYDNSIRYSDWVLSQVVDLLARRGSFSVVVYSSDHGENLLDDEEGLFGHAIGNSYDLASASFIWVSESVRQKFPGCIRIAEENSSKRMSLSNLPHSLLHIAGIDLDGLDYSMSVFSSQFEERPRWYRVRGELKREAVPAEEMMFRE